MEGLDDLLDEFTGEEQTVSQARETTKAYQPKQEASAWGVDDDIDDLMDEIVNPKKEKFQAKKSRKAAFENSGDSEETKETNDDPWAVSTEVEAQDFGVGPMDSYVSLKGSSGSSFKG